MNLLQQFEAEQVARLTAARPVPEFQAGDTLRVMVTRPGRRADARPGL